MIKNYRWREKQSSKNEEGYVVAYIGNNTQIKLQNLIMNCPKDKVVDHINHNHFDNCKKNLRICFQWQNCMNKSLNSNNQCGHRGVYYNKRLHKWSAQIKINRKQIYLGTFDKIEDAIKARMMAEEKYFGEFRNQECV